MWDETLLVAAVCRSRKAYEEAKRIGISPNDFGEAARFVLQSVDRQYRRDPDLQSFDRDVLRASVLRTYGDGSVAGSILDFIASLPADVSGVNVMEEVRLSKLGRCATELATRLATGQHDAETESLLAKYKSLLIGEGEAYKFRLDAEDFEDDGTARIPLFPRTLNDYVGGGVLRGHNVTIYGRPDSCKTMLALNNAAMLVKAGYKVLYVANEEPAQDITRRLLARLVDTDISELRSVAAVRQAIDHVSEEYSRWNLYHKAGVDIQDVRRQAEKLKPDVIIIDQLKNISAEDDNRALQLDKLARQVRELGISSNAATISVTQAGESAHNKPVLTMGDIEWSNTGIPGAADLLIGIGVTDELLVQNKRMLSIPKNKVNGRHGAFPVWVDTSKTKVMSRRET